MTAAPRAESGPAGGRGDAVARGSGPETWGGRVRAWARTTSLRQPQTWRLASGLVLFGFVLTHFLNHALGLVSIEAMEGAQEYRVAVWQSGTGTILLYGAFAIHIGFAFAKLITRRTWRLPPWEAAQIGLGLMIPVLLFEHVMANRGLRLVADIEDVYRNVLFQLWPGSAVRQSALLLIVWGHAVIGLHHWLKNKRWYGRWRTVLLVAAVLVPTLALTGWIEGARRVAAMALQPPLDEDQAALLARLDRRAETALWAFFGTAAAAAALLRLAAWLRPGPRVTYPNGRTVRGASGATLLEISRAAGIAHASVCGGRGRCTTCRVLILEGAQDLPPPGAREVSALERIGAPPGVRLACQVRPAGPVTIRPLVPLREATPGAAQDAERWGVERRITILFADLRGFTSIAERLYPYDSVFLLNRYFEVMTQAIQRHGGMVDKFLGDGIMALFGVAPARGAGSRDALLAARDMLDALDHLNQEFGPMLPERLRMGLGVHMGPAVLGRVGGNIAAGLTALGDSVNIASRLESLNKDFNAMLVVSDAALRASGFAFEDAETREIMVRGRTEPLTIHVARSGCALAEARQTAEAG